MLLIILPQGADKFLSQDHTSMFGVQTSCLLHVILMKHSQKGNAAAQSDQKSQKTRCTLNLKYEGTSISEAKIEGQLCFH